MLIVAAVIATLAVVSAVAYGVRWWIWRPVLKRRMVVVTDSDVTFEAVVLSRRGPLLVLADVTVRTAGASHRADGQIVIERRRVLWMQAA